jgi:hypothetical protein
MPLPDIDSIETYGGVLVNYAPVEDPTTDLDAAMDNKNRASTAAMTHTLTRAICRFVGNAGSPTDPSSGLVHDAVWGSSFAIKPVVAKADTGIYDVTFPVSVQDELGAAHLLNLRGGYAQVESSTFAYVCSVQITSANVARIRIFKSASTLDNAAGLNVTLSVF